MMPGRERVLGLIPARGGSKGIPRKNIRMLAGKPLLQYTAEAALAAKTLSKVVLSTEDPEIAQVGRLCGLEVPFLRPTELARDNTPTLPVLQHAIRFLEDRGECFQAVCLLQPTTPFRSAKLIDQCVRTLYSSHADSVITVLPVPPEHNPHWVYFQSEDGLLRLSTGESTPMARRQDLPSAFHREGSVYVMWRDVVMCQNSLYGDRVVGCLADCEVTVNLDTIDDWNRAEKLMAGRQT